ncbi:MAG: YhbY family RNA-binding protein [Candidatus Methanoperedens sp.]
MNKQQYRAEATGLEPSINIGKSGIGNVIEELKKQLKTGKMVKVKFLKSAFVETGKKELAEELADSTGSDLIELRGNTAVFRRKG